MSAKSLLQLCGWCFLLVCLIGFWVLAVGQGRQYEGQQLIVAMPGGQWAEVTEQQIFAPFEEATGADIIVATYGTSADAFSKMLAAKMTGDFPYDVLVLGGGWQEKALTEGGLLEQLDYTKIPNMKNLYPAAQPIYVCAPNTGYGPAIDFATIPLAYRTDKIERTIDSWYDLLDPAFKGKIGWIDLSNLGGVTLMWTLQEAEGGDIYDSTLDKAFTFFETKVLPQDPVVWSSSSQSQILLSQGEMWISQMWDGRALSLKRDGLPVEVVIPKEGAWATKTTIDIVTGCENLELAHAYINHRLSPEAQAAFTSGTLYAYTNPAAEELIPADVKAIVLSAEQLRLLRTIDFVYLGEYHEGWIQRFSELIGG